MNKKQTMSIALGSAFGTSIGTTIGAINDNVAMSLVYGSMIGLLIGVILALVVFKEDKKKNKMKEYKVIVPKIGFRNRVQNFEDLLNQYAREGWVVNHIAQGWSSVTFERDKNR